MPKTLRKLFKVDLQLFNDGGATGGAEGSAAATENAPKAETKPSGSSRRSKQGEFDNVVFGKQEGTTSTETTSLDTEGTNPMGAGKTDVTTTSNTLEERRKAYNDLINGEYKDLDQERFQQVFDRRFKQVKGMEADLASQKPVLDKLMARYGVEDMEQLDKALTEDYDFWERAADAEGETVEKYLHNLKQKLAMQDLERENAEFRKFRQRQIGEQQARQQIESWNQEAEKVKEIYPTFDIKTEVQNKQFLDMLKSGVDMETAYKVLHLDEITQNAARTAAQTANAQAQAKIKQKASRPSENGTSSQSAAIVRNDVSTLTRAERAEIARRVQRGEKISF
jgi:hypothetical protein